MKLWLGEKRVGTMGPEEPERHGLGHKFPRWDLMHWKFYGLLVGCFFIGIVKQYGVADQVREFERQNGWPESN